MSLTPEQVELRRKTIGGSDIGAILGENPYKTAYELWEEKVEGKEIDFSNNRSVVIGNLLETALLEKYSKNEGLPYAIYIYPHYHKEHKFLSANLDGTLLAEDLNVRNIIEIKTASMFNRDDWGPSGSQIVPMHYYAQIAHYMLVTEYNRADISVGFIDDAAVSGILCELNGSINDKRSANFKEIVDKMETRTYTFYRDPEMEELILEAAKSFYNDHMKPWIENGIKTPPPMDFSNKKFQECLRKKYSIEADSIIKLPKEFMEIKNNYVSLMVQSKAIDKLAQEEKAKILEAMGNNEKATLDDGSYFLRKTIKRKESIVKACEYTKFEFKESRLELNRGEI